MKANELMIGDLVKPVNVKYAIRVGEVSEGFISNDTDTSLWSEDEIEPIPLTPEILKKNFEKKTFYGIYDDYFDLDIREYSDGLYIVTYHSCEFNIPDQAIHISWVHELQHFLNHCGITHEIKL